ncbi:hypothetical protein GUJ93_ZPchr0002g26272 [Zizania palustris]|uniref:Uncharacterized protein n=1 Tax=Zizania palustris TaxID=103762 RepID=A0A8J5VGH8_ZIZPA|nr:hypothetical protein GUJ93_ZPchr0002g26272 [Zizania palustris]
MVRTLLDLLSHIFRTDLMALNKNNEINNENNVVKLPSAFHRVASLLPLSQPRVVPLASSYHPTASCRPIVSLASCHSIGLPPHH